MRILFVSHSFGGGGAERYLTHLVSHCISKGNECVVIGPRDGRQVAELEKHGCAVIRTRSSSTFAGQGVYRRALNVGNLPLYVLQICKVIASFKPGVVYSNTSAVLAGAVAARILHVPHIWHIHENFWTFGIRFIVPRRIMRCLIAALSRRIIFVTDLSLKSLFPLGSRKAIVIHNGVDTNRFEGIRRERCRSASRLAGVKRVAFFGELSHRKGIDVLLRAIASIAAQYPVIELDIWGNASDGYGRFLKELGISLGLGDRVAFKGWCEEVAAVIGDYDAVVVPSRAETFSLVTLEAMAAGAPVIVSECGGPEEFVEHGVDGYVVPVEDHIELGQAMKKLLDSPDVGREMALRAQEKTRHKFMLSEKLDIILKEIEAVGRVA